MPSSWLNVPHFQSEIEHSWEAASVRMLLAHYGDNRAEAELPVLLETQATGTRAGNLMRLSNSIFESKIVDRRGIVDRLPNTPTDRQAGARVRWAGGC
jgi:hypothetical protein